MPWLRGPQSGPGKCANADYAGVASSIHHHPPVGVGVTSLACGRQAALPADTEVGWGPKDRGTQKYGNEAVDNHASMPAHCLWILGDTSHSF